MIGRIKSGYVPDLEFETDYRGCYLFGCKRHNHLEYEQKRLIVKYDGRIFFVIGRLYYMGIYLSSLEATFLYSKYVVK